MLPAVLAITHTLTTYYILSGQAVKGLMGNYFAAEKPALNDLLKNKKDCVYR